jgi:hypothetical protein
MQLHLKQVFNFQVPCSRHYDGEGHLLLHLFEHVPTCPVSLNMSTFTDTPMTGCSMHPLLVMLMPLDSDEPPSEHMLKYFDPWCWSQVLEMLRVVKQSQFSLLTSLFEACAFIIAAEQNNFFICSEDVAAISICITKAVELPQDHRITSIIRPLVNRVRRTLRSMRAHTMRSDRANESASREATIAIKRLRTLWASMTVFGDRNRRMISCARSRGACSPAVGWLPAYTD